MRLSPRGNQPYRPLLRKLADAIGEPRRTHLLNSIEVACQQAEYYDERLRTERNLQTAVGEEAGEAFIHCWDSRPKAVKELRARVFAWLPHDQQGRCPYCTLECRPNTLDHFLEKKLVPELALHDRNLVPSCADCNSVRGRTFGVEGQSVFHFYDDPVEETPDVLRVEFDRLGVVVVARFYLDKPLPASAALYARHFKALDLAQRYRTWAATVLPNTLEMLRVLVPDQRDRQVALQRLACEFRRRRGPNEPWAALYRAIANDPALLETAP